ncbi:Uncharacterised protein [uncultured archaeon]|nr:Uncharacterised protein [uncultured archaeon]
MLVSREAVLLPEIVYPVAVIPQGYDARVVLDVRLYPVHGLEPVIRDLRAVKVKGFLVSGRGKLVAVNGSVRLEHAGVQLDERELDRASLENVASPEVGLKGDDERESERGIPDCVYCGLPVLLVLQMRARKLLHFPEHDRDGEDEHEAELEEVLALAHPDVRNRVNHEGEEHRELRVPVNPVRESEARGNQCQVD